MKENFGLRWMPFHVERDPALFWVHVRFAFGLTFLIGVLNIVLSQSISNYTDAPSMAIFQGVVPDIFLERYAYMLDRGAVDSISYLISLLSFLIMIPFSTRWHYVRFFPSSVLKLQNGQSWVGSLVLVGLFALFCVVAIYSFLFDMLFLAGDHPGTLATFLLNFPAFCFFAPMAGVLGSIVVLNVLALGKMFELDRQGQDQDSAPR